MTKSAKLENKYGVHGLETIEVVYDTSSGEIIVDSEFLQRYFNVGKAAISTWFNKKGAVFYKDSTIKNWTSLKYILAWHKSNIDRSKSMQGSGVSATVHGGTENEDDYDFLDGLPKELRSAFKDSGKDSLDKMKDLKEIQKRDVALKKEMGDLVPSDIPDKAMTELALVQIGLYRQDIFNISSKITNLEKVDNESVKNILETEYRQRIKSLKKISNMESESNIFDMVEEITKKLDTKSVDEIMGAIREL